MQTVFTEHRTVARKANQANTTKHSPKTNADKLTKRSPFNDHHTQLSFHESKTEQVGQSSKHRTQRLTRELG